MLCEGRLFQSAHKMLYHVTLAVWTGQVSMSSHIYSKVTPPISILTCFFIVTYDLCCPRAGLPFITAYIFGSEVQKCLRNVTGCESWGKGLRHFRFCPPEGGLDQGFSDVAHVVFVFWDFLKTKRTNQNSTCYVCCGEKSSLETHYSKHVFIYFFNKINTLH